MSDLNPESTESLNPQEEVAETMDFRKRTSTSVSLYGSDYALIRAEADATGCTMQKILKDYCVAHIREKREAALVEKGEVSKSASELIAEMEQRLAQTLESLESAMNMNLFAASTALALIDAKIKWDIATTGELPEETKKRAQELAPDRYENVLKAAQKAMDQAGSAKIISRFIENLSNPTSTQ